MIELSPSVFNTVTPIFGTIDHSVAIVYAVLERNSPGRVFVNTPDTPSVALLYAEGSFFYIGGDENSEALAHALVPLLFDRILPQTKDKELVLFSLSTSWRQTLDRLLQEKGVIQIRRKVFKFNPEKFIVRRDWRASLPEGFCMRAIDESLAEQYPLYKPIVDPASKRLGVCLMRGSEIVSECTSVFVGRGEAEIDIRTAEGYQGRGYATLTGSAFIETCLARSLIPQWACWPKRQASWALAKKLGFEEQPDVPAHYWAEGA